jgi:hypothetical protein
LRSSNSYFVRMFILPFYLHIKHQLCYISSTLLNVFCFLSQSTCVLQSVTMPTKNFFPSSSLAPTHSFRYPFLCSTHKKPLSGMTLNCTFSIPVSWITRSSEPPCHSSHITFIEDTNNDTSLGAASVLAPM